MHLIYFEMVEHKQWLSRLEEVAPAKHLLRIVACLQEGSAHLQGFGPNIIHDRNMRYLRVHWMILCQRPGECEVNGGIFRCIRHWGFSRRFVRVRFAQDRRLPTRSPNRGGERAWRSRIDVTKEAKLPPLFPILRIVRIDTRTRTQHTEKGVLNRIDHNPSMS